MASRTSDTLNPAACEEKLKVRTMHRGWYSMAKNKGSYISAPPYEFIACAGKTLNFTGTNYKSKVLIEIKQMQ
jgi:hypothetical protein